MRIKDEDWLEIAMELECHHAIFSKIWHMGKPSFSNDLDTAAVKFNKDGQFVEFLFNESFYNSLDLQNKLFVICHESLHILLNHGLRAKDTSNRIASNTAMDIVVNHLLVNRFGFVRENIVNQDQYCWIDTIFKSKKNVKQDESYEYYYNLFEKSYGDGSPGEGDSGKNPKTVDSHEHLNSTNNDDLQKQIIDKISNELSELENKGIKQSLEKHLEKSSNAGSGSGSWIDIKIEKPKVKPAWQSIIKKWEIFEKNNESYKDLEQWVRLNRRMINISQGMFLPSNQDVFELDYENIKVDVFFYIDTSGSCVGYKDKFFNAAYSLDKSFFKVRIFSFDTAVEEFDQKTNSKFYGGGGTSFSILENHINSFIDTKEIKKYPSAVFVITDGYSSDILNPKFPNRWHWFLTEFSSETSIGKGCHIHKLNDFQ